MTEATMAIRLCISKALNVPYKGTKSLTQMKTNLFNAIALIDNELEMRQ